MTIGHVHGYPRLPLSPGISIADGYARWRAFVRTARPDMLALAAAAVCRTWSDDPMTRDLTYIEHDGEDEGSTNGCCSSSRPCPDHFDDVFEVHGNAQEDRHLQHGAVGGSAA